MSRIGKNPINIPAGVKANLDQGRIVIAGPKGTLSFSLADGVKVDSADGKLQVTRATDSKFDRALHGTTRAIIANMVKGVSEGFSKSLSIIGVGYKAELQGERMTLQLGYSHPIVLIPPASVKLDVQGGVKIVVSGADKALVGEVAAKIRSLRPPEPYKGKGIRYDGERVRKKAGKTAA